MKNRLQVWKTLSFFEDPNQLMKRYKQFKSDNFSVNDKLRFDQPAHTVMSEYVIIAENFPEKILIATSLYNTKLTGDISYAVGVNSVYFTKVNTTWSKF